MSEFKSIILMILFAIAIVGVLVGAVFLGVKIGTEQVRHNDELVITGVQNECYQSK